MASVVPRKVRRETSGINRLQRFDYIGSAAFVADAGAVAGYVQIDNEPILERDRKSTRLNSSHLGISYAVFCLKKKQGSVWDKHLLFESQGGLASQIGRSHG